MNKTLYHLSSAKARSRSVTEAMDYRAQDESYVNTPTYYDHAEPLRQVSQSFGRPIRVLDFACGTGRYWWCLQNIAHLTGVDVSAEMLKQAEHPVKEDLITFPRSLLCQSIFAIDFRVQSFDFIFGIGLFGVWVPLDAAFLCKISSWLVQDGKLFLTVIDKSSPAATSWKRALAQKLKPYLPAHLQTRMIVRMQDYRQQAHDVEAIFGQSPFVLEQMRKRLSSKGRTDLLCWARLK